MVKLTDMLDENAVVLRPEDPVEAVFMDCVRVYRERSQKYTHTQWDDNFQFIAERMRVSGHPDFTAADAATVLLFVKEARQDAASRSGRVEFDDDSFRDSDIDNINYRVIRRALRDREDGTDRDA